MILESFRTTAKNKGIEIDVSTENNVPNRLIGDPARLTQILNNLFSNALKFTEEGKVKLYVSVLEQNAENAKLQFEISDTGIGIDEERINSIFESFTQASQNTKRLFGGTGLGLTISKQLTELQGGQIFVESEEGVGSTFTVELDFGIAEGLGMNGIPSADQDVSQLKGMKILLAEDNLVNQKVMKRFLERWEVDMKVVNNGKEAVDALQECNFDMILMDLQMPEMDGYEATERIRKLDDPYKRKVPIVAITAAALKEVREHVYAAGMNDFVTKPFNPAELEQKLAQIFQSKA